MYVHEATLTESLAACSPCAPTQWPGAAPPQELGGSGRTQAGLTGNRPWPTENLLSL